MSLITRIEKSLKVGKKIKLKRKFNNTIVSVDRYDKASKVVYIFLKGPKGITSTPFTVDYIEKSYTEA